MAVAWLVLLADVVVILALVANGATARRRARDLAERETVNDGWATALDRREREVRHREYLLRWAEWMGHR